MNFEYFDIHSHIYFPDFDKDREEEIKKIKKAKIGTITIGTNLESSKTAIEIAKEHEGFYACVGQHPSDLVSDSVFDEKLIKLCDHRHVVAIGECGLDYFRIKSDDSELKTIQKTIFEYQIDLALTKDLPLMLHIRSTKDSLDAYEDALEILEHHSRIAGDKLKGNAHFFAGDIQILKRFLSIGFTASFTGVVTFTRDYDEYIKYIPLDMIMAETDSPFVAPVPHRGKRNSPLYIPEVVKKLAEIRGEDLETLKNALISNTLRVFPRIA
ncbi:MAG: TatD family hydrolase [Minisyncoccia bacterium]